MPAQSQPPLLKDYIEIPEPSATSDSDFVLKLSDGVENAERTLAEYVLPPSLVANFDEALNLISSALTSGTSRAAYLHGSFGAGKSHFMAVLHALLRNDRAARSRPEFAPLLTKHDWLGKRDFLLVPYHMLGARSLEQKVLGEYVLRVREMRPDCDLPAVHRTDALLEQSRHLREQIGDTAFIAGLPGEGEEDDWEDDPVSSWTPAALDAAFAAAHDDEARRKLVSDLLSSWQKGFFRNALEDAEGFVALDRGLTEIARHAKSLGYDALVLFLDELILWLANSIGDERFVAREVQKITNFVEGSDARRPIPVITFIARQRDLRELVGEGVTGATELGFQDALDLAKGRFDRITLEDRNLPEITRKRLLKRIGGDGGPADHEINRKFEEVQRVRADVWDTLLGVDTGSGADLESFRQSYPFSPAFLSTLVYVSSALQRSRTALKLMRQLLMERREELRLGQLIPLGDLYDVLSRGGDQPFTEKLKAEFETAQKLYQGKLRPYLLETSAVTDEDLEVVRLGGQLPPDKSVRVRAFQADDRLIKTLLLSALAPSVPALRDLTPRKLSALNHGSFVTRISGNEVGVVQAKLQRWAERFGEIKVSDGDNPSVRLELVGIDVDSVINSARHFDTQGFGARKAMVKRLLWEELGVSVTDQYVDLAHVVWRGSKRSLEVVFGNIRDKAELRDENFHPFTADAWRLVIDYPFDDKLYQPTDDRARVGEIDFADQTVCWIPASLTGSRQTDLGRLVILDSLLSGQRFESHAKHLSEDDRRRAHAALTSQRDALMLAMRGVLRQAYGLAAKKSADVLTTYDEHLINLAGGPPLTLPVGARFNDALRSIADQVLQRQFPAHPDFDPDRKGEALKSAELRTVFDWVRRAVEDSDDRVEVERKDRQVMRRIANPLRLGEMHEAPFVLGRHWVEHFHRKAGQEGITGDLPAKRLFEWLDDPQPQGLDPLVARLVLAVFAEQTDRTWMRHGAVLTPQPELSAITEDMTLRTPERPEEEDWKNARDRAMHLFGFMPPVLPRGRLVALFVQDLSKQSRNYRSAARDLVDLLERHQERLGLDTRATTGRLHTAQVAADLLDGLDSRHNNVEIVRQLAHADLGGPAERVGTSIRSAREVSGALSLTDWDTLDLIADLDEQWRPEAEEIFADLRRAAQDDELTTPLIPVLRRCRSRATDLLRRTTKRQKPMDPPPLPPQKSLPAGRDLVPAADLEDALAELRAAVQQHPGQRVEINWRILP
ncbi:hypothetical protein ACFWDZ_21145 [Micromonospora aurantiaca]|uniref:hypothetical protein n=1 Tax=Micromonospora aurantiaca (nom. illeg.) TaxID=47850 RepID=UPI003652237E